MAHSRLEKIGTIYTRVSGLIKAGAMKIEDRPLWYEIYQAFPPSQPPRYDRPAPDIPIRPIFYPEDNIRAKFHKKLGSDLPSWNLTNKTHETVTQIMISTCKQIELEKGITEDEAFNEAFDKLKSDGVIRKSFSQAKPLSVSENQPTLESEDKIKPIKVKDLFENSS